MSSGEQLPRRSSSKSSEESSQTTPNIIEFVDSQDPNVKSAIQRHTAYHSAAQRRDARLQSLRRGAQSRYLEWGRRQSSESQGPSPASSTTSIPTTPALHRDRHSSTASSLSESSGQAMPTPGILRRASSGEEPRRIVELSQAEEEILVYYRLSLCQHSLSTDHTSAILSYIRTDDACSYLLVAYAFATRARLLGDQGTDVDRQQAQYHFGRGTNILWNRLRDPIYASSDVNVQAVLLLIAYTADYGQAEELQMHQEALQTMIEERGGIEQFISNSTLYGQLLSIRASRRFHLTLSCEPACPTPVRDLRTL